MMRIWLRPFQNPAAASARARHHPLHRRSLAYDRFLHDQAIDAQVRVILRVRDRAL